MGRRPLYCDFNQLRDLPAASPGRHICDPGAAASAQRTIVVNEHCYGCTAGAGSSCSMA